MSTVIFLHKHIMMYADSKCGWYLQIAASCYKNVQVFRMHMLCLMPWWGWSGGDPKIFFTFGTSSELPWQGPLRRRTLEKELLLTLRIRDMWLVAARLPCSWLVLVFGVSYPTQISHNSKEHMFCILLQDYWFALSGRHLWDSFKWIKLEGKWHKGAGKSCCETTCALFVTGGCLTLFWIWC